MNICVSRALIGVAMAMAVFEPALSATYYLDCAGQDGRDGTTAATAWQSLSKARSAGLQPGDRLLLKRGCSWNGPFNVGWSGNAQNPITIGAYGAGALPMIHDGMPANVTLTGHDVVVESLSVHSEPVSTDPGCRDQPVGTLSGFVFASGSNHNTLRYVSSTGHARGVWMASGSRSNRVLYSEISGNTSMTTDDKAPDNDAGAFGILINGDSNEVAYNTLSNNLAWCSYDYGIDGSSVEIYDAVGNRIHHNLSQAEGTFTELGGSRTADNVYAFNLVESDQAECIFLNVRGRGSKWGPNLRTIAIHNTVYLTGDSSQGVVCAGGCASDILTLENNVIWADWKAVYVDGPPKEDHNLFWRAGGNPLLQGLSLSSTSKKADPRFTDPAKADFRLQTGSPALDAGAPQVAQAYGFTSDFSGIAVPQGAAPDLGCLEHAAASALAQRPGEAFIPRFSRKGSYDLLGRTMLPASTSKL